MAETTSASQSDHPEEESRRDFLLLSTITVGAVGTALGVWPFIHSMNPSRDVLALASSEVDLSPIEEGQAITIIWRGKPVFIRQRTAKEIEASQSAKLGDLKDPQKDEERVQQPQWLVMIGICTHLGCIPLGQKETDNKGEFEGWFCPCHGSHYDTAGRIRKGPAPRNLEIPPYRFLNDTTIRIG